jgi:KDO2-lipid IV(A) lauroyltransferase
VRLHSRPWYLVEAAAIHSALWLFRIVPAQLSVLGAACLSTMLFAVMRRRRRETIDNVLQAGITDDPREARRIAAHAFRSFVLVVVESTLARQRLNADNWQEFITLHIPPEAEALLRQEDTPVLVVAAHMGNWEVAALAMSFVKPVCAIYRPFNNPYIEASMRGTRSGQRLRLISKYATDPLRFVKPLRRGEILAIMMDQYARGGIFVDFFGRPARTTPTVALLHLVTKVPVLVTCTIRTGPLRYDVHGVGPLSFERTGDREEDVRSVTQQLTRQIEAFARKWPEQYMWGHRRWKTGTPRPKGKWQ